MSKTSKNNIPSYRLHKPSGLAVVRLNGRDFYLGKHGTPKSRKEYERLIAEWLANNRQLPAEAKQLVRGNITLTINELVVAYWQFAESYYRKNGKTTGELTNIRDAIKPLVKLHGHTSVVDFGPMALKTVRQAMIDSDLCRSVVNARINRIRRIFKWGVENQLVASTVLHALQAIAPLKRGRCEARESTPVKPVPLAYVEAVSPFVSRQVQAMIRLQLLTGMRPGEVTIMRCLDLDTSDKIWEYKPISHKTEHHGRQRIIYVGPRAQQIVESFLKPNADSFLFSPQDAMSELNAYRRTIRKTPLTPSQARRKPKNNPRKEPGDHYTSQSYSRAIATACNKAGVPCWSPNRLRHNAGTFLRKEFGIEAARVILGHTSAVVTEIYAEIDQAKAAEIMAKVG
ncbi:MAG: tyrosine-type recombinase/integrase [Planctomycetota bacterium]|jgi:integrase